MGDGAKTGPGLNRRAYGAEYGRLQHRRINGANGSKKTMKTKETQPRSALNFNDRAAHRFLQYRSTVGCLAD